LDSLNIELEYLGENWIQIKDQLLFPRMPFEELRLKVEYSQLGRKVKGSIPYCPCHGEMNNSKVYISRRNSKRPLPNEVKIEKMFKEMGFEIMYFETLGFSCQVSITRRLKILAGSHGAGLTNMLWSQTNSRIIEVMPPDFHNPCYRQLAQNLGVEYDCIDLLNQEITKSFISEIVNR
jgi:capsular polysaccharide biosynthesis protein